RTRDPDGIPRFLKFGIIRFTEPILAVAVWNAFAGEWWLGLHTRRGQGQRPLRGRSGNPLLVQIRLGKHRRARAADAESGLSQPVAIVPRVGRAVFLDVHHKPIRPVRRRKGFQPPARKEGLDTDLLAASERKLHGSRLRKDGFHEDARTHDEGVLSLNRYLSG